MTDPVVHAEVIGRDPARLRDSYGALLGWGAQPGAPVAPAVSAPDACAVNDPDPAAGPVPVGVGGGAARLARAVALGGSVVLDVAVRPDGALSVALFADPEGSVVGLAGPVGP